MSARHNDALIGFPLGLEASTTQLVRALRSLSPDKIGGGCDGAALTVQQFAVDDLQKHIAEVIDPGKHELGTFKIFSTEGSPKYLLWHLNHAGFDALSVLSFFEELTSRVMRQQRRWRTTRELLASSVASYQCQPWFDTDGRPIKLVEESSLTRRRLMARVGASFAVARTRVTGRHTTTVGYLMAGRAGDEPVAISNSLKMALLTCSVDVATSCRDPKEAVALASAAILSDLDEPTYFSGGSIESVDVLVNPQSLNWYDTARIILGDAPASLEYPIVYHQELEDSAQVRVDLEMWDPISPTLRFPRRPADGVDDRIYLEALDLYAGSAAGLPICQGARSEFTAFKDYVHGRVERLCHESAREFEDKCKRVSSVDARYAIGIVAGNGAEAFLFALACMQCARVCHFVGDSESPAADLLATAQSLNVPVAVAFGDGFKYVEPAVPARSVVEDAGRGWAYITSSGSTGSPKVTLLTHAMSQNIIGNATKHLGIDSTSNIAMLASPKFDAIYFECLIALPCKKLPKRLDLHELLAGRCEHSVFDEFSHLVATPTVFSLLDAKGISLPETLMSVGERLPESLLETLDGIPGRKVYDLYGPSEAGIWSGFRNASFRQTGFKPIDNIYFRASDQFEDGRNAVSIGLSFATYGADAVEVVSGDSANFNGISIEDLRRSDGLLKIGGRRVAESAVTDFLAKRYNFVADSLVQVADESDNRVAFAAFANAPSPSDERRETATGMGAKFYLCGIHGPPLTPSGKLDTNRLLEMLELDPLADAQSAEKWGVTERVARVWAKHVGSDASNCTMEDLGASSLDALRIQIELEREGVRVPLPDKGTTLADLVVVAALV